MSSIATIVAALVTAGIGVAAGMYFRRRQTPAQADSIEAKIQTKLTAAKEKLAQLKEESEKEIDERKGRILELEKIVASREDKLNSKLTEVEKQEEHVRQTQEALRQTAAKQAEREDELKSLKAEEEKKIVEISGLTSEQAAARVLTLAEDRTKEEIVRRVRKMETEGQRSLEEKARNIMASVIQRYAASHVAETTTSHVDVPDSSMIGRIIGKEGRNIQHIERLTGCEVVIDDTPNSIMITGFSPIRRQVAKMAIESLIRDGRIHPGRIEEAVEQAKEKITEEIREAGEAAVYDLGIVDFPEKLVQLIGRLKYRTSYRQNILQHSLEAAHVAVMLANELGADVNISKKATLLHDIGKALDHEVEGNHVEIGEKVMRKFSIDEKIVRAAAAHHEDYPFDTKEAIIVQVADAISAARPGARRESLEEYVKRMEDLEQIATSYEGVSKAYAIHAGREMRVFVEPKKIDDLAAIKLAQDIAKRVEQELTYPGEVKVNVIRETRADALAR